MVDIKEIDSFFENTKSFKKAAYQNADGPFHPRQRRLRLLKLLMPSIAAVLISLVLIFPHLKNNSPLVEYDLTAPKAGELEKLHVEKTSFSVTDSDGKISSFTADLMEETEPSSKIVKLTNPKGQIALDDEGRFADIKADIGYYNQTENIVKAEQNLVAVYDKDTTIKTNMAEYDFKKATGFGPQKVFASGTWGKLWADGFFYDKNAETLRLNGHSKMVREDSVLTSSLKTTYFKTLNKIVSEGNVVLTREDITINADKLIIFLKNAKDFELNKIEAFGHVVITTAEAVGKGDFGRYLPHQNLLELEQNVVLKKGESLIYGDKVIFDIKTSVGKMVSKSKDNRITGVIRSSTIKETKHEKK